jgi:hypothetical protein
LLFSELLEREVVEFEEERGASMRSKEEEEDIGFSEGEVLDKDDLTDESDEVEELEDKGVSKNKVD